MRKLVRAITIYRALANGEKKLWCMPFRADILSEAYSRVLNTSNRYGMPSLRCFTESFRVAYEYSKKPGYSGEIAVLTIYIWSDGTCTLENDNAFVHRLWDMADWLDIASRANRHFAHNLNYASEDVPLYNIVSFGGQRTARAVAFASKIWVIHVEKAMEYFRRLTEEEIAILQRKRAIYPSLHAIHYSFDKGICDILIENFDKFNASKAWVKNSKAELGSIKAKLCVVE